MPVEFETKFILKNELNLLELLNESKYDKQHITQIYTTKHNRFRAISKYKKSKKTTKYIHTFKKDIEGEVLELEHTISKADFDMILKANNIASLRKYRFTIKQAKGQWDIDFLLDETGNVYFGCCECEQPKGLQIDVPDMIKPFIHYEVIHEFNSVFSNFKLTSQDYAKTVIQNNPNLLMLWS